MSKENNIINKIFSIRVLVCIVCIASIAGGIVSALQIAPYKATYDENTQLLEKYEKIYNNDKINSTMAFSIFKDKLEDRADTYKENIEQAKSQMKKYIILTAVLFFVALLMLICFISTFIKKGKKTDDTTKE